MLKNKLLSAMGGAPANYIEDVFSTYLYTGNNTTQTITNGIDVSTKGGLVWIKDRTTAANNYLFDTERGATSRLFSNLTNAAATSSSTAYFQSFNNNGFTVGYANSDSASNYASWTFRKQPKFFDVVTYTGNGTAGRTVSHNLGSVPGCIIVKSTTSSAYPDWLVYHRSTGNTGALSLNTTNDAAYGGTFWNSTTPTSSVFTLGDSPYCNQSGTSYVAYLFAHDSGGFGLTGTDNVISCGRLTTGGAAATVNLGYEVQWLLTKELSSGFGWNVYDIMKGDSVTGSQILQANTSGAEISDNTYFPYPTATGFGVTTNFSNDMIYIAIRRGPMKVPTDGTSVFLPVSQNAGGTVTTNFPVDLTINRGQSSAFDTLAYDRLRGNKYFFTNLTDAEGTASLFNLANNTGYTDGNYSPPRTIIYWNFRRAPGFFDEVCWAGNDAAPRNINHNLTVIPEMMIVKNRTTAGTSWIVYHKNLTSALYLLQLETTAAQQTGSNAWRSTAPTASVFTVGNDSWVNQSGSNYVNYLFATCAGVSKVGSYTGTGTTQQINCGFTSGARFVLIKRTNSTGDWYVWDTARGIVSGNDPYLLLNSTAAETTGTDYIDTYSAGFEISSTAPAAINASGGTFIFLAIA